MAILLYCVAAASAPLTAREDGVGGSRVERYESSELAVFVSRNSDSAVWTQIPARESALQFHRVMRQLFQSAAVLPFRFPTILAGDAELETHLQDSSSRYRDLLRKFQTSAQMEVLLTCAEPARLPATASGTEFLRQRRMRMDKLNEVVTRIESCVGRTVQRSHLREARDGVRWFALIQRDSLPQFKECIRSVDLPAGYSARISGPWPVGEFFY